MLSRCSAIRRASSVRFDEDGTEGIRWRCSHYWNDIRQAPRLGRCHFGYRPRRQRRQITEFTDCGDGSSRRSRRAGKGFLRVRRLVPAAGSRRAKIMWRIGELIDEHAQEFAETRLAQHRHAADAGAVAVYHLFGVLPLLRRLVFKAQRHRIRREDRRYRDRHLSSSMHAYTLKEPYSVVGLIFPWNGPIFNASAKLAPALAAGCSMLRQTRRGDPAFSTLYSTGSSMRPGSQTVSSIC